QVGQPGVHPPLRSLRLWSCVCAKLGFPLKTQVTQVRFSAVHVKRSSGRDEISVCPCARPCVLRPHSFCRLPGLDKPGGRGRSRKPCKWSHEWSKDLVRGEPVPARALQRRGLVDFGAGTTSFDGSRQL